MGRHCFVDINSLNFLFMYQVFTRYRVEIFVYGNGDNASFVLLGDSGAEPIGREVSELMDNYGEANGGNGKSSNPAMSCDEEQGQPPLHQHLKGSLTEHWHLRAHAHPHHYITTVFRFTLRRVYLFFLQKFSMHLFNRPLFNLQSTNL
ncbi:unnamed protein product [Brassica oleracea var. botrytis]|uniref:(rape) hypothetical protein n=2 Tax=Brassica napus TaxID=3708 RepID=A0A816J095_BRANA|nr:unnamed protein product [Brassica napus]